MNMKTKENVQYTERYLAYMGKWPQRIPHYEHWSNPDAETYITGIDYYNHPKLCRLKMNEMYPMLELPVPESDNQKPKPTLGVQESTNPEKNTVRWGDSETATWVHGEAFFRDEDSVFEFSPLKKADFTDWPHVVENMDFTSIDLIYNHMRKQFPAEWGDSTPAGSAEKAVFYNTMFMWPVLTFGWELFLQCCLDERFERIMDEFAEINRRVFNAIARLPVNFVVCHDDIVTTRGPVCSPNWMNKYIFPRYEEYFSILKASGKEVIFMVDGCADAFVDNVMACGARGIISEPYTDYRKIAGKYKDCFIAGEGDNRILMSNDKVAIKKMVEQMVDTSKMSGGYMMCIGNHIPWNIPPEAVKYYLDLCAELAHR